MVPEMAGRTCDWVMLWQGDEVKKGQVLGFIEQLGTFMPVEVPLRF